MRSHLIAMLLAGALISGAPAAQAASEHNNDVKFNIAGVQYFSFTETGHSITSGQPYGGASGSVLSGLKSAQIIVKAGRKGSTGPTEWFETQLGNGSVVASRSWSALPKDLNFAVEGTMVIRINDHNTTCDNVIVAQGHTGAYNDWWIGGPFMTTANISHYSGIMQTCRTEGSLVPVIAIITWAANSNWFTISLSPL
jgi:hypothetical protein